MAESINYKGVDEMIGPKVAGEIKAMLGNLIDSSLLNLDSAFLKSDGGISLSLGVKIKPCGETIVEVETSINFVEDRVKKTLSKKVSENQPTLFKGNK